MDNAVALAAIGLATSSVGGLIWLAKFVAKTLGKDLKAHTIAANKQTAASREVLKFMKNLNGKLAKITKQTIQEQNIEHQTVHKVDKQ